MRVISYNLRKHRAAGELADLVERYSADVLCLQEADTANIPPAISGLRLADATSRNRLGLAVYYRENTYR
ncbi:MAG: endonuclease/exonuclease/phosphatase family protein, partial [Microbacterium sp.]